MSIKCCYCGKPILNKAEMEYWEDPCDSNAEHNGKPIHSECAKTWRIEIKIEFNPNAPDIGAYLPTKNEASDWE